MEFGNQTVSQLVEKNGRWDPRDYDLLGLLTAGGLGGNHGGAKWQILQGASGGVLSFSVNDGFDGALSGKKNADWVLFSTFNGMLAPVSGGVPLLKGKAGELSMEITMEIITGGMQGGADRAAKEK